MWPLHVDRSLKPLSTGRLFMCFEVLCFGMLPHVLLSRFPIAVSHGFKGCRRGAHAGVCIKIYTCVCAVVEKS